MKTMESLKMSQYNLSFIARSFAPALKHKGGPSQNLLTTEVEPICPVRKTEGSVGLDLATPYDFTLPPGETVVVELGLIWRPDPHWMKQYCLLILSRSGLASKGVFVANAPGLIDTDYTGPEDTLKVILHNSSLDFQQFKRGDRIAQVVLAPFPIIANCGLVEAPASWAGSSSNVGSRGGIGSTGR